MKKRILVVEVNWLGDCVMTLPLFKALRIKYPDAWLAVMAPRRVIPLFESNPFVNECLAFDEKSSHGSFVSRLKFLFLLRGKKYDTAILIHRSFTRTLLCYMAGIRERVGWKRAKTAWLLTQRVALPDASTHRGDFYARILEDWGVPVGDRIPCFSLTGEEKRRAETLLCRYKGRHRYIVAVNPSCNWELKKWPVNYFVELIRKLETIGAGVFLIGAAKDIPVSLEIEKRVKSVTNLCGKTDIRRLALFLSQADALVSNDSGPAHLAASLGTKVLVLFGPTSPGLTAPRGSNVRIIKSDVSCPVPCYNISCEDNECMKKILPREVFEKLKEFLNG